MPTLDAELRRLAEAMVDDVPPAPSFADLSPVRGDLARVRYSGQGRRRRVIVLACVVAAVAASVVVALRLGHDGRSGRVSTPPSTSRYDAICRDDPGYFTNANGATFGPISPPGHEGEITPEMLASGPEYVAVGCGDHARIAGWIKAEDILRSQEERPHPDSYTVYDRDGTTILGRYFLAGDDGCGFVGVHETPQPCGPGVIVTSAGAPR
jgi:hypothetical protein